MSTAPPAPLGREFLLWLWHRAETTGGSHDLAGYGTVGVVLDTHLELESVDGGGRVTLRGDRPTDLAEAGAALRAGKLPTRARLLVAFEDSSLEVTLDADTFDLRSLRRVAAQDEERAGESPDEERARNLLDLAVVLDALFATFLGERLDRRFPERLLPKLRDWVRSRRGAGEERRAAAGS